MDWKKWIATNARGTPMSLSWLPKCFPVPVANYGVTPWAEGKPKASTKQMTFANLDVTTDQQRLYITWEYGMTVPNPDAPKAVEIDKGGVDFAISDLLTIRKLEVQLPGVDPLSRQVVTKPAEVYGFYVREGEDLLVIEVVDVKESLDGEKVDIEIAKA